MNKTLVGIVTLGLGTLGINALSNNNTLPTPPTQVFYTTEKSEPESANINKTLNRSRDSIAQTPVKTNTIPENSSYTVTPRKEAQSSYDSNCDPNYSGCVPIASDVDCAGGRGNGPAYVRGPVRVIGSDIYDLDRDNDGWGCE